MRPTHESTRLPLSTIVTSLQQPMRRRVVSCPSSRFGPGPACVFPFLTPGVTMMTTTLERASQQLFQRSPDERFGSLSELRDHCSREKQFSTDYWQPPQSLQPKAAGGEVTVSLEGDGIHRLSAWSFSQLCRLGGVSKETINRLSPETASRALRETLPTSEKPLQLLATGKSIRSLHGVSYTRLWNADLLSVVTTML